MFDLLVSFLALAAPVPEGVAPPKGPPPTFRTVASLDAAKGIVLVNETVAVPVTVTKAVQRNVGGQNVVENVTVTEMRQETRTIQIRLADNEITRGDGTALSADAAKEAIQPGMVLVVSNGPLDPAYRRLMAKEAVIFSFKKADK